MQDFKHKLQKILLEEFAPPQEAFIEINHELRNNARSLGIDYDNSLIINTNRQIKSPADIGDWSQKRKQWAGYGSSWLDWISGEMPHWLATNFYVITVNSLDIISINSKQAKIAFEKQYVTRPQAPKDMAINYEKLYNDGKGGVSFRPYNRSWGNMDWYNSIDMDSAVIVNKKAIKSVKLLLDASEIISDFKDRSEDY